MAREANALRAKPLVIPWEQQPVKQQGWLPERRPQVAEWWLLEGESAQKSQRAVGCMLRRTPWGQRLASAQ